MIRWCFLLISYLMLSSPGFSRVAEIELPNSGKLEGLSLTSKSGYFQDSTSTMSFEQIKQQQFDVIEGSGIHILGSGAFWIEYVFINSSDEPFPATLVGAASYSDAIELYNSSETIAYAGDRSREFFSKATSTIYRTPTIDFEIPPGKHVYYLKLQTKAPPNLNFNLWDTESFHSALLGMENIFLGVLFGFVAIMIGYNLFLAVRLRRVEFYYYVGYISCFLAVQFIFTGLAYHVLPKNSFTTWFIHPGLILAAEGTAIFGVFFAIHFLELKTRSPKIINAFRVFFVISAMNIIYSLFDFNLSASLLVLLTNSYVTTLLAYVAIKGCIEKYRPAYFYLVAWGCLIVGSSVTMGRIYGLLPDTTFTQWSQFLGGAFEVVLLSLALGDKIRSEQEEAHEKISILNEELRVHIEKVEEIVDEKTRDIRSIMEHIPLGVFMIDPNLKLYSDYSEHLKHIYPKVDFSSNKVTDFLFQRVSLSSDLKSQAVSGIESMLDSDEVNFIANQHTLPHELTWEDDDRENKVFELTWNAIPNQKDVVDKMLVTMRDVTEMRKLQEQSRDQQEELTFIGEILSVPAPRFLRFIQSCRDFISQNRKLVQSQAFEAKNFEVLKLMFINMHTMKGAARSLYLKKMSTIFHDIEQYYASLQKDHDASWSKNKMIEDLKEAEKVVDVYEKVAKEKLGRSFEQTSLIEFHAEQIEVMYRRLEDSLMGRKLDDELLEAFSEMQVLFFSKIFKSTHEVIEEIAGCLPLLAKDLGRAAPKLELNTAHTLLTEAGNELFQNIFVHLFRNSMDHGIEPAEDRLKLGKPGFGSIFIHFDVQQDYVMIDYYDDGRGLNIGRIKQIALVRALFDDVDKASLDDLAELIFYSGLSTANRISDISGRGVGMDAVRRFIEDSQGSISIDLETVELDANGFCPFKFRIQLPRQLFAVDLNRRNQDLVQSA